jgi:hypothetical protein
MEFAEGATKQSLMSANSQEDDRSGHALAPTELELGWSAPRRGQQRPNCAHKLVFHDARFSSRRPVINSGNLLNERRNRGSHKTYLGAAVIFVTRLRESRFYPLLPATAHRTGHRGLEFMDRLDRFTGSRRRVAQFFWPQFAESPAKSVFSETTPRTPIARRSLISKIKNLDSIIRLAHAIGVLGVVSEMAGFTVVSANSTFKNCATRGVFADRFSKNQVIH